MEFYPSKRNEKATYIVSYKILGNNMEVTFADFSKKMIPYTKETEQKVLDKMADQVIDGDSTVIPLIAQPASAAGAVTSLGMFIAANTMMPNTVDFAHALFLVGTGFLSVMSLTPFAVMIAKERNLTKLTYYLDNQNDIDNSAKIRRSYEIGLSKGAKKEIAEKSRKRQRPISLNNIDHFSLRELKRLKKDIDRLYAMTPSEQNEVLKHTSPEVKQAILQKVI